MPRHGVRPRRWRLDLGRDRDVEDIVFRTPRQERDVLDRDGLIEVLGDIVFGRLAVQALVLGGDEPLEGRWIAGDSGPRVLRVQAADMPVAEIVDYERDGTADRILFNLGDRDGR